LIRFNYKHFNKIVAALDSNIAWHQQEKITVIAMAMAIDKLPDLA
jgi:hypothetical protein